MRLEAIFFTLSENYVRIRVPGRVLTSATKALMFSLMDPVRTLEQVEADVRRLPLDQQERLREWLENLLEDRLELTDAFKEEIEAGKKDVAEGRVRIRRP